MAALAEIALREGCQVTVASMPRAQDGPEFSLPDGIELEVERQSRAGSFRWAPGLLGRLAKRDFSLVHSHGLWTYASLTASRLAKNLAIPHLLAPCGMLQPRALQISRQKKQVAGLLFQNSVLKRADCLHAKSEAELQSIRDYGLSNPVAVVPNPVPSPPTVGEEELAGFRQKYARSDISKFVLFLGRLHPVKGLERLLHAWTQLADDHPSWCLLLAGPDEGGYQSVLEALINDLEIGDSVQFTGPLLGREKWIALRSADLFIMPSDFENFGSAIAEAMMAGLPVITTTGTPWRTIEEQGCGWYVDTEVPPMRDALRAAMAMTGQQRRQVGENARVFAADWSEERVMESIFSVYAWLLGNSLRPDCVEMN
jgi:glycosyltransferase involved in cell wall biosynthesis